MPDTNRARPILIREDTPLPANLPIESEAFLPGWRAVRNLDGYELGRKIEEAKWYFFYLAGEIGAIALGREGLGTLRRAVKRILAKQEGQKFNSLESHESRFETVPRHSFYRCYGPFSPHPTRHWPGACKGFCPANTCRSKWRNG